MSATDTFRPHTIAEYPELTPEEVGRRFLKLIDSLKSFDKLSSDRVREVMQLPMAIPPSDTDDGFLTMSLPESGWQYSFSYSIDAKYPRYTNASFEFKNKKDDRADMAPVCSMDFAAYVAELKKFGFVERDDLAQYDAPMPPMNYVDGKWQYEERKSFRLPIFFFTRGNVMVGINERREADTPDEKLHHACVETIGISKYGE